MAAGDQGVGEADEPGLLVGITRRLIRTAERDIVEADVLRLPVWQGELELLTTPATGRLWWRRPPVDHDSAPTTRSRGVGPVEVQLWHTITTIHDGFLGFLHC